MNRWNLSLLAVLAGLASACDEGAPSNGGDGGADGGTGGAGGEVAPPPIKHTFKAIAGVSMGGIGASLVGSRNPERFDAIASLGGPLETVYMLRSLEQFQMGGFCTLAELEAILAANPGNPDVLNDPAMLPCMGPTPAVTGTVIPEFEQHFNDWAFTTSGGTFDRTSYLEMFQDLSLALGNPFYDNPDSPALAPGVTREMAERAFDECLPTVVHTGFHNKEYNPRGEYPVITFCDGEEPVLYCKDSLRPMDWCASQDPAAFCAAEGGVEQASASRNKELFYSQESVYDPCYPHRRTMATTLAADLNRNGRRDYGEPLIANGRERWSDVGTDGCDDAHEDGSGGCVPDGAEGPGAGPAGLPDPNGDGYHWKDNATGTEQDWLHEEGEPFEDFGVDGVDGTNDRGEGNGAFDMAPGYQSFLEHSPRLAFRRWDEAERRRLSWYVEGGIRDLFNFGVQAAHIWGDLKVAFPREAVLYDNVLAWPGGQTEIDTFDPLVVQMEQVPRFPLFFYGNVDATPLELERGDGDHVGTPKQAVVRFLLMMRWIGSRWDGVIPDPPGDYSDFNSRAFSTTFPSEALGADRDFAIVLPPGYDAPENAGVRYPVLVIGHGYGMQAAGSSGFYASNIIYDGFMQEGQIRKMIVVYVDGNCCFVHTTTGERACTLEDETGEERRLPDWQQECVQGSFYADRDGYGPGDDFNYERHVLELLDHVDANYRTLPPEE